MKTTIKSGRTFIFFEEKTSKYGRKFFQGAGDHRNYFLIQNKAETARRGLKVFELEIR